MLCSGVVFAGGRVMYGPALDGCCCPFSKVGGERKAGWILSISISEIPRKGPLMAKGDVFFCSA